jgi:general secretion pathway protein G
LSARRRHNAWQWSTFDEAVTNRLVASILVGEMKARRGETRMDEEMAESAEHACETNRIRRLPFRRVWLLALVLVLGVGLILVVVRCADMDGLASRRVDAQNAARGRATRRTLRQLHTAVFQFRMDSGRWPTAAEGLSVLVTPPAGVTNWPPGGYLETAELPKDGWGRDCILELRPDARRPFVIKSLGADGVAGGEGYNADLFSSDDE